MCIGGHPATVRLDGGSVTLTEEEPPMDAVRFDAIAKTVARGPRRTVVKALIGGVTGLMALGGPRQAPARKRRGKRKKGGEPCRDASSPTRCGKGKTSVCTNLTVDNAHCGNCQTACTAPETCQNGACGLATSCSDTIKNGDETDVDCGGSCGATCSNDKTCNGNGDCASNHCCGNTCQECCTNDDCPNSTACIDRICKTAEGCLAGQEYCPLVHCGPFCVCATSVDTQRTVCADNSVRLCGCTTDEGCTAQLAGVGFPNARGICVRDLGGLDACACQTGNVCIADVCGAT